MAVGLRPDPLGELKRSPDPLGAIRGLTSKGKGGKGKGGREEIWGKGRRGEERRGEGKEGEGKEGTGGTSASPNFFEVLVIRAMNAFIINGKCRFSEYASSETP